MSLTDVKKYVDKNIEILVPDYKFKVKSKSWWVKEVKNSLGGEDGTEGTKDLNVCNVYHPP